MHFLNDTFVPKFETKIILVTVYEHFFKNKNNEKNYKFKSHPFGFRIILLS